MSRSDRRRTVGSLLIVAGLVLFAVQWFDLFHEGFFFVALGVCFLAVYVFRTSYGLLVPGCILTGLGLGVWLEDLVASPGWEPVLVFLGAGFVAIFVTALIREGCRQWWPLLPGGILLLIGVAPESGTLEWIFEKGWPLILVAVGLFILFGALGVGEEDETSSETEPSEPVPGAETADRPPSVDP